MTGSIRKKIVPQVFMASETSGLMTYYAAWGKNSEPNTCNVDSVAFETESTTHFRGKTVKGLYLRTSPLRSILLNLPFIRLVARRYGIPYHLALTFVHVHELVHHYLPDDAEDAHRATDSRAGKAFLLGVLVA